MKIKKIFLILIIVISITGCKKVSNLSYDEIINNLSKTENNPNTYKRGYKYFIPKGLSIYESGTNYAIIRSKNNDYYLYVDLISYNSNKNIIKNKDSNDIYYRVINSPKNGYVEIKKYKNNKYLIEIMYNYAKIEVMVDDREINSALVNSTSIVKSVIYDKKIIEALLKDDNLIYTEENYNMFEKSNKKSTILNYTDENIEVNNDENEINDSDVIN